MKLNSVDMNSEYLKLFTYIHLIYKQQLDLRIDKELVNQTYNRIYSSK